MKRALQGQRSTKSELVRLLSFEGFNAFEKGGLGIFAIRNRLCQNPLNFCCGGKCCLMEQDFGPLIKCTEVLHNYAQTAYHFVGSQLLRRNGARCTLLLLKCKLRSDNRRPNFFFFPCRQTVRNQFTKVLQSIHGAIYYCGRCVSPSQHRSFICVNQEPSSMPILSTHYENCDSQCCNRSDRLDPSRPSLVCQARPVANDRNSHRTSDECDSKKCISFLHESSQSCLKGIIA